LVANSPRLIAGSYVLHRLLVPRHPPCALSSLIYQRLSIARAFTRKAQMLASTVQFSRYGRSRRQIPHTGSSERAVRGRTVPTERSTTGRQPMISCAARCPEPSGPNSVPGRVPLLHGPLRRRTDSCTGVSRKGARLIANVPPMSDCQWDERPPHSSGRRSRAAPGAP
jgi:hypothetical protein